MGSGRGSWRTLSCRTQTRNQDKQRAAQEVGVEVFQPRCYGGRHWKRLVQRSFTTWVNLSLLDPRLAPELASVQVLLASLNAPGQKQKLLIEGSWFHTFNYANALLSLPSWQQPPAPSGTLNRNSDPQDPVTVRTFSRCAQQRPSGKAPWLKMLEADRAQVRLQGAG